jgi:hypothetical protein
MASDLTVVLEDRPGSLAELGEATGRAGVNIEGLCAFPSEGGAIAHVVVEDAAGARRALEDAGFEVRGEREVVVLDVEDRPGVVGEVAGRVAGAGVNLDLAYLATNTRLVLGSADVDKLRGAV